MSHVDGVVDALSLLIWAMFLPLIIIVVLRSRRAQADSQEDAAGNDGRGESGDRASDPTPKN